MNEYNNEIPVRPSTFLLVSIVLNHLLNLVGGVFSIISCSVKLL